MGVNFYEIALVVAALVFGAYVGFQVGKDWPYKKDESTNYVD